ncbi:MAG: hypothetical protein ABIF28_05970 [Pseudomonadota bacterium]
MTYAIIWIITALLLGFWTLLTWTADAVLTWPGWNADALATWPGWVVSLQPPVWLTPWLPEGWLESARQALLDWGPTIQASLQQIPDLTGWLSAIVWAVWLIGAVGFLLMGLAASAIARMLLPRKPEPAA